MPSTGNEPGAPKPSFDPGLTQSYTGALQRTINESGDFNVRRRGTTWRDIHPYSLLVSVSWARFIGLVLGFYLSLNFLFALVYLVIGADHLQEASSGADGSALFKAFFFSAQTVTTVGYGSIYPIGVATNAVSALEALMGLMGFAVVTGLVFGRFSKPNARIAYSRQMLIAPYSDRTSLQARVVNRRASGLLEVHARLLLMTVESVNGTLKRRYQPLELERDNVLFLALTWTLVHPIGPDSPLFRKSAEDLARLQAEVLITLKGFDETFAQTVHSRRSYRHDEIQWGARFRPAFEIDPVLGQLLVDLEKIHDAEAADLPSMQ